MLTRRGQEDCAEQGAHAEEGGGTTRITVLRANQPRGLHWEVKNLQRTTLKRKSTQEATPGSKGSFLSLSGRNKNCYSGHRALQVDLTTKGWETQGPELQTFYTLSHSTPPAHTSVTCSLTPLFCTLTFLSLASHFTELHLIFSGFSALVSVTLCGQEASKTRLQETNQTSAFPTASWEPTDGWMDPFALQMSARSCSRRRAWYFTGLPSEGWITCGTRQILLSMQESLDAVDRMRSF